MSCSVRYLLATLLLTLPFCWGFVLRHKVPFQRRHLQENVKRWSQAEEDVTIDEESLGRDNKEVELWLDLRDTALFPQEAMDYLAENKIDRGIIDRVVLSQEIMEKVILQQHNTGILDFLYVHGDDLILSYQDQSLPCGKLIRQEASGNLFNPILALEIVQEGWVLMEQNEESEESVWMEEVSSLMTFLLSSSGASLDLNGGLDISRSGSDSKPSTMYTTPAGSGVAIACPSGSLLMEASKAILTQRLTSLSISASTSPGGILLPSSAAQEDDLSSIIVPSGERAEDRLAIAMVLPMDIALWKTAIDLVTDRDDEES